MSLKHVISMYCSVAVSECSNEVMLAVL